MKHDGGYLLLDDTATGGTKLEAATETCAHCHTVVVLNPERTRARNHCRKCNHYICDNPACHTDCHPWKQMIDHAQENFFRRDSDYNPLPNLPWDALGNKILRSK